MIEQLLADLSDERAYVDALVDGADWSRPTPAAGWDVHDQVWHLAYFDGAAAKALADPASFAPLADRAAEDFAGFEDDVVAEGRALTPEGVRTEWARQRSAFAAAAAGATGRAPWFGVQMSPASLVTARIMETWAHGVDIADALGEPLSVSDRLRHVVFLGWRAIPFAYATHGRTLPRGIGIAAELPGGGTVELGPADADGTVSGSALDLALVVTQRRHVADTALLATGTGVEWLSIAQAFAGPPGAGRAPSASP